MLKKRSYVGVSLLVLISLSLWALASSGGGGGGDTGGGGGTQFNSSQQAAASAAGMQGAISLSSNVANAANMASGYIPPGYAPGKRAPMAGTAAIANIDPRLKDVVDKMLMQMQRPAVKTALSKTGTFTKAFSAPAVTSSVTVSCPSGGSYVVNDSMTSAGTATTHTLTVAYTACTDTASYNIINGSISASHTIDAVATTASATVAITNLTDTTYTNSSLVQPSYIFALNGTFTSATTGNLSAGTATALGTFSWTMVDPVNGDMVTTFNFGSGTPITDIWTIDVAGPDTTEIHTANGTYGMTVSAPGAQSISLAITLTGLEDKYVTNASGTDEWINGSITISWSPDLSQWGCLNGTYNFTTAAGTPIHVASGDFCPTSGVMQVNNALIEFGVPVLNNVTVTLLPGGPSEVFADCLSMGGGMCSSSSQGSQVSLPGPPAAGKP